jgi:hypothetical protein
LHGLIERQQIDVPWRIARIERGERHPLAAVAFSRVLPAPVIDEDPRRKRIGRRGQGLPLHSLTAVVGRCLVCRHISSLLPRVHAEWPRAEAKTCAVAYVVSNF